eukprot:jgi/Psemu1/303392/fgenesh1_kg.103_\
MRSQCKTGMLLRTGLLPLACLGSGSSPSPMQGNAIPCSAAMCSGSASLCIPVVQIQIQVRV